MPRRPSVLLLSIGVHAIVLFVLASADLWRPITDWPTPRSAMAFEPEIPRLVHIEDIALPHETPQATQGAISGPSTIRSTEAAPIEPPSGVTTETGRESANVSRPASLVGIEAGDSGIGNIGAPIIPASPLVQAPIRLHSGIKAPSRLVNVVPVYPAAARAAHVEGVVIIEATVDAQGNVAGTLVLRSIPLLDDAALAAVRRWKFSPTLLNGTPVPIVMTVTVNFTLTQ
jgi:protein TonB